MKNYKSLVLAAIALAGSLLASCSKEGYWNKTDKIGEGFSFPSTKLSYVFAPADDMTKVQVPIVRGDNRLPAYLDVTGSVPASSSEYVSFPAGVMFEKGQAEAIYEIGISKKFDLGQSIQATLTFQNPSTAGIDTTVVTITLDYNWISLGKAKFKDSWFWENLEGYVEAEIFQSEQDPSVFKLADPYTKQNKEEHLDKAGAYADAFLQFKVLKEGETYKRVSNAQKGWIYYDPYFTGVFYDGGLFTLYHPSALRGYESLFPYAAVQEFQENGLPAVVDLGAVILDENGSGWLSGKGRHLIVFPNVPIYDYSISVKYTGREIDVTDEEIVKATVALGEDIDFAKVVLIEGKDGDVGLEKIMAEEEGILEITEGGDIKLPIVDPVADQTYSIVVAGFAEGEEGAEPELVSAGLSSFKYVAHGVAAPEWELIGTGNFTYNSCFFSEDEDGTIPYVEEGLELYRFPDSNSYKITGWCSGDGDYPGGDLFFTIEEDGTVVAEEGLDTGLEVTGYAAILADDASYWGGPSGYVGRDGSINIYLVYYFDDADYTYICDGLETFELAAASAKAPSTAKPVFNFTPRVNSRDFRFCTPLNAVKRFNSIEKKSYELYQ